jgi:hypothetical protein
MARKPEAAMHFYLHFPDDDSGNQGEDPSGDETIIGDETRALTDGLPLRLPEPADDPPSLPPPHIYYEQQAKDIWPTSRAPEPPADGQIGPPAALFQKTETEHLPLVMVLSQYVSARSLTTKGKSDRAQAARASSRNYRMLNRRNTGDRYFAEAEPERWGELFNEARQRFYDAKDLISCATDPAQPFARRQAWLHEAREHLAWAQLWLQQLPAGMREQPRWQHLHENIAERLCWV